MKTILRNIIVRILELEAKIVLWKYKPRIITITGSVGKTSTKDAIFALLSKHVHVRRTRKSFNSEFGVPLTILDCDTGWNNPFLWFKNILKGLSLIVFKYEYPSWLILEVGADHPGDIQRTAKWVKSDIVVITRLPEVPVHVEFFPSVEAVIEEKAALLQSLKKKGVLLLNADDEKVMQFASRVTNQVETYGTARGAQVRATHKTLSYNKKKVTGLSFKLHIGDVAEKTELPGVIAEHHVYPVLAAVLVAKKVGMSEEDIRKYVADYVSPPGRMRLIQGLKGAHIIDDTYNSSPVAAISALETLDKLRVGGKKICVLGDMLELGSYAVEAHRQLGARAGEVCDQIYVVGPRARYITEGALGTISEKYVREFSSAREVGKFLEMQIAEGDVVLVKGSQSMRMERVVLEIMAHPELAGQLLVRQEDAWGVR